MEKESAAKNSNELIAQCAGTNVRADVAAFNAARNCILLNAVKTHVFDRHKL